MWLHLLQRRSELQPFWEEEERQVPGQHSSIVDELEAVSYEEVQEEDPSADGSE